MPMCFSKQVLLDSMQLARQQLYLSSQHCMQNCLVMHLPHKAGPDLPKTNRRTQQPVLSNTASGVQVW
jgi:hypothetical protein